MRIGTSLWAWKFSACEKKKPYPDEHSAKSMAGQQRKRSGQDIQPYKCPFAAHWHIGHPKQSRQKPGPQLYCFPCDKKIAQEMWDKHQKKLH